MKQLQLPEIKRAFDSRYGGSSQKGHRKSGRPFVPKIPMHVILKSTRARGTLNLRTRSKRFLVDSKIYSLARRYHVQIIEYANAGNHLHLLLKSNSRENLTKFLRLATGQIAQAMTGAKKGLRKGKFWSELAWSRLVRPGKMFSKLRKYVRLNQLEMLAQDLGYEIIRWNKMKILESG